MKLGELAKHSSVCPVRKSKGSACRHPRRGAAAVRSSPFTLSSATESLSAGIEALNSRLNSRRLC